MGVASVLRVNESTFMSNVTRRESFHDHKLPFRSREVFSLTPTVTLVKFDSKFDDRRIKFIIKHITLQVLVVCPEVLILVFLSTSKPKSDYILHVGV